MRTIKNDPNWIQVFDDDEIPPTKQWKLEHLQMVLKEVLFQIHRCGKDSLVYRAEITLRRDESLEGGEHRGQEHLVVEVECPRNGECLQYAGNVLRLCDLPAKSFTIYSLAVVATGGTLG